MSIPTAITYETRAGVVTAQRVEGFFVGWPKSPTTGSRTTKKLGFLRLDAMGIRNPRSLQEQE